MGFGQDLIAKLNVIYSQKCAKKGCFIGRTSMSEQRKCSGCGVYVQSEDETKLGYVPKQVLQRETVICQRCFRLKHYNELQDVPLTKDDFLNILHHIGEREALV